MAGYAELAEHLETVHGLRRVAKVGRSGEEKENEETEGDDETATPEGDELVRVEIEVEY